MLPVWLTACTITTAFVALAFGLGRDRRNVTGAPSPLRFGIGAATTLAAALLVVVLRNPALPVLGVGVAAVALQRIRPRLDVRVLALLFAVAVALGTLARLWHEPAELLGSSGAWTAAGIGAVASLLANNLPATVLLTAGPLPTRMRYCSVSISARTSQSPARSRPSSGSKRHAQSAPSPRSRPTRGSDSCSFP